MKRMTETVLTVTVTFIVVFIINFTLDYISQPNGKIILGPVIKISDNLHFPIDIQNYKSHSLSNLKISVPKNFEQSKVITSAPLKIDNLSTDNINLDSKFITISEIEANSVLRILIPLTQSDDAVLIKVLNSKEKKIIISSTQNIYNPFKKALIEASIMSLIYAIFMGIATFIVITKSEEIKKRLKESEKQIADLKLMVDEKYKNTREQMLQTKLLLLARLSDYSKELSFWRDTIRKILYSKEKKKANSEEIIKEITYSLKTYSTLNDKIMDFDEMKLAAKYLKEEA